MLAELREKVAPGDLYLGAEFGNFRWILENGGHVPISSKLEHVPDSLADLPVVWANPLKYLTSPERLVLLHAIEEKDPLPAGARPAPGEDQDLRAGPGGARPAPLRRRCQGRPGPDGRGRREVRVRLRERRAQPPGRPLPADPPRRRHGAADGGEGPDLEGAPAGPPRARPRSSSRASAPTSSPSTTSSSSPAAAASSTTCAARGPRPSWPGSSASPTSARSSSTSTSSASSTAAGPTRPTSTSISTRAAATRS